VRERALSAERASRTTMNWIDSGRYSNPTERINGSAPPTTNTAGQPRRGMTVAARKPPADAPSGKPQYMTLVRRERRLVGKYSDSNVPALGIAPPRPTPVTSRSSMRSAVECANAQAIEQVPNNNTEPISTGLRPMRSASGPATREPPAMPNRAALNTGGELGPRHPKIMRESGRKKTDRCRVQTVKHDDQEAKQHHPALHCRLPAVQSQPLGLFRF
jgi:hypothetical protein